MEDELLSNIREKLKSGFYLDKINIDGKFKIWKQKENCLVLVICNGLVIRLPLPLRFDEEWFKKYKKLNLSVGSIICFYQNKYLK